MAKKKAAKQKATVKAVKAKEGSKYSKAKKDGFVWIGFRVHKDDKLSIQKKADKFADGNLSKWLLGAGLGFAKPV